MSGPYPLGSFVLEECHARGWPAARLAREADLPEFVVHQVVWGERRVDPTLAAALGRAFGTSAALWLRLAGVEAPETP